MLIHPRRTLVRALIVSLLVHAGLLLGVTRMLPAQVELPAAAIKVVMNRALPGAAQQSATLPAAGRPVSGGVSSAPDASKAAPKKLAVPDSPSPDRAVQALASSSVAQDIAKASPASTGAAAGLSEGTPPARVASSTSPQDGVDAEDVKQYRIALGVNARRVKRYPPLAHARGWEGVVEIALVFRHLHPEPTISLSGSSGKKVLDDQALEMIRQAVRQTDLPDRLKGKDFRIVQEVTFSLDDER